MTDVIKTRRCLKCKQEKPEDDIDLGLDDGWEDGETPFS